MPGEGSSGGSLGVPTQLLSILLRHKIITIGILERAAGSRNKAFLIRRLGRRGRIYRDVDDNCGPLPPGAFDRKRAAQQPCSFSHANQAQSCTFGRLSRIEPDASV